MSILIKGMEMPINESLIVNINPNGSVSTTRKNNYKKYEAVPAVDVVPVRHGRWIADKEDVEWGNDLIRYRCSECKERPYFDKDKYKFVLSPYCPFCGTKMDESEDGK